MLTLAHTYRGDNVDGYLIQPKLDGVRAVFDGERLTSRTGKEFHPPRWWVEDLQALQAEIGHPLDGELVCRRQIQQWFDEEFSRGATLNDFNDVISVVRRKTPDTRWEEIFFAVFDYIPEEGDVTPYAERYERLDIRRTFASCAPSFLVPIEGVFENGVDAPMEEGWLLEASYRGWEGIMLRNPDAPYERKRTRNLLKVKPKQDREVEVIEVLPGTGKHEGRMGALLCHMGEFETYSSPRGAEFRVGTGFTDAEREESGWLGKIITVEYFELTPRGVPRHPRFKGVRDYE